MQIPQLPQFPSPDFSQIGSFDLNATTSKIAEQIGDLTIARLQVAIAAMVQTWLAEHPIFAWIVSHPLKAGILLLVILLLVQGLFGAIAALFKNFWLSLLNLPYQLLRRLTMGGLSLVGQRAGNAKASKALEPKAIAQTRVAEILTELSTMQRQQEQLMREVEEILATYDLPNLKKGWLGAK
jgi:hypothetical protein